MEEHFAIRPERDDEGDQRRAAEGRWPEASMSSLPVYLDEARQVTTTTPPGAPSCVSEIIVGEICSLAALEHRNSQRAAGGGVSNLRARPRLFAPP